MKKLIFSVIAVMALSMGIVSCNNGPKAKLNNDLDSVAYAMGVMNGMRFMGIQDTGAVVPEKCIDVETFLAAFIQTVMKDTANLKISVESAQNFLNEYGQKLQAQEQQKREEELKKNKEAGSEFMAKNATKEGVVTLESGLQIETLVEGTGAQPSATDKVLVNYVGTLIDGTQFDANDSIEFNLTGVVKGFSEGISNMKEGGSAIITMPSDMAYGDRATGSIPAGSVLQFKVDLHKIVK